MIASRRAFRFFISATTVISLSVLADYSSRTAPPEARYAPTKDLLDIIKDFQRLAKENTYRFVIPKDVTDVNIMKATLVHLDDYEKKNKNKFTNIVQFNKTLTLEQLRDYEQTTVFYHRVAETDKHLGSEATKNLEALETFLTVLNKPLPTEDPFQYIKSLDEKVAAWNHLIQKHQDTTYEFLARCEEERIDRAKITFVEANRYHLKNNNQLVILNYSQLITKHRQSKNIHRFIIDFGDFYALLAKEYTTQYDPKSLSFEVKAFDQFAKSALKLYTEVVQIDGIVEKIEAQDKVETMRGLIEKITKLSR